MGDKPKKKRYRDIHGTTRVGDFLRSIGKSNVLEKLLGATGELLTGDIPGAIEAIASTSELSTEEKEYALKMLEMDAQEIQEVTKRWESDMTSDSWLSKNIRPMTLAFLTLMTTLFVTLDSANINFEVDELWIDLLKTLLVTTYLAYFGSRGFEKYTKFSKK